MYNRYIPQSDGTYLKHRLNEPQQPQPRKPPAPCPTAAPAAPVLPPEFPPEDAAACQPTCSGEQPPLCGSKPFLGFFKNLLPKDMDAADLMIILLLLLMAGDCCEEKNTLLLTLALYFLL